MSLQEIERKIASMPVAQMRRLRRLLDAQLREKESRVHTGMLASRTEAAGTGAAGEDAHGMEASSMEAPRLSFDAHGHIDPVAVTKRVAGLGKGTVELAPDFNDPLPDAFWLGETCGRG